MRTIAARSGQLLQLSDISRDLGVAVNTIKAWLSVLEASFQIVILRPYFSNIGKRAIKAPKIYFTDTGMLCHLVGLQDPAHAASGPMAGPMFEGLVLMEIIKRFVHTGCEPTVYFWRTSYGVEVDIIVDWAGKLIPAEVKLSSTPHTAMTSGLKVFLSEWHNKSTTGYIVYPGKLTLPLAPNIVAQPWSMI